MKKIFMLLSIALCLTLLPGNLTPAAATPAVQGKKIIFIPLDNRPITDKETREVAEKAGYNIVVPPETLLGTRDQHGDPDGLWQWLRENTPGAKAAVVSTDAMLYGSLVGSRNHELTQEQITERVNRFQKLHQDFPRLPVYGFGTILRTLLTATHSGAGMEPAIYQQNAVKIRDYSALRDKNEMGLASKKEQRAMQKLGQEIATAVMEDWKHRQKHN